MQALILLVLSVGVFVGFGNSQPAPAADFVFEAGELLNDNVGISNKAEDAAQKTIKAFLEAIQSKNIDALFKLVAHTEGKIADQIHQRIFVQKTRNTQRRYSMRGKEFK